MSETNYGPLTGLIGTWQGESGMDVSPEPEGSESSPYYETLRIEAAGEVDNAEEQDLAFLYYRQIVTRKSNDEVFHDQTGYWIWDAERQLVMHSFSIPRAVNVLAGGHYGGAQDPSGNTLIRVKASCDDPDWGILQSPFMREKAKTLSFEQSLNIGADTLHYEQHTLLDIYGREFDHSDANTLRRID